MEPVTLKYKYRDRLCSQEQKLVEQSGKHPVMLSKIVVPGMAHQLQD